MKQELLERTKVLESMSVDEKIALIVESGGLDATHVPHEHRKSVVEKLRHSSQIVGFYDRTIAHGPG